MARRPESARFRAPRSRRGPTFGEALALVRAGHALRLTYIQSLPVWDLNDMPVAPEVVVLLSSHREIEPDGDGLFEGAAAQTWRIRT